VKAPNFDRSDPSILNPLLPTSSPSVARAERAGCGTSMPTSSAPRTRGTSSARALFLLFAGLARTVKAVDCLEAVIISDDASYAAARACTTIDGSLFVDPNYEGVVSIRLAQLAKVGGGIFVERTKNLRCLDLPELISVNGSFSVENNEKIRSINVAKLNSIDGSLTVRNNDKLPSVVFPALTSVGGSLVVADNTILNCAGFPVLTSVGG